MVDAWAPPVWFVGFERWMLGDTTPDMSRHWPWRRLVSVAIAVSAYVLLYRRFDRVTSQFSRALVGARGQEPSMARWCRGAPVRGAVGCFVSLTIERSVLHQGVVVGLLAGAGGLVFDSSPSASWRVDGAAGDALVWTLLWVPTTMMSLSTTSAIRLALSVPMDLRANWIFRMTEDVDGRARSR